MALLMLQGASFASFDQMGMAGPGILGPVADFLCKPITNHISLYAGVNYLNPGRRDQAKPFVMGLINIIAGISYAPQLAQPYGNALVDAPRDRSGSLCREAPRALIRLILDLS